MAQRTFLISYFVNKTPFLLELLVVLVNLMEGFFFNKKRPITILKCFCFVELFSSTTALSIFCLDHQKKRKKYFFVFLE